MKRGGPTLPSTADATIASPTVRLGFVPSMRFPTSHPWCTAMRDRVVAALTGIKGVEVVSPGEDVAPHGLVQNDEQAIRASAYLRSQDVDGVLVGAMDFGDEISAAAVAANLGRPVLLFGTKEGDLREDGERVSDSFCGTLSIGVALRRRGIPFAFAGVVFPEEDQLAARVRSFAGACAATRAFRGARIGQIGVRPERFETVAFDEAVLLRRFGQKVVPVELSEIVRAARELPEGDVRIRETAEAIAAEATELNVNRAFLEKAARLELALKSFYESKRLSAMALQCWPALRPQLGISACSTLGRLTGQGMLTACEVDVLGALDMLVQRGATLGEATPFFVDWTIQHRTRPNTFLAWHCGNGPTCLRARGASVTLRNRSRPLDAPIPEEDAGAGVWEFAVRPGPVTLCRTVEYDGELKMLIARGEVVEDPARERGTSAWVEVPDLDRLYRTLVEEGFVHHASMIHGDVAEALEQFCRFVGVRPVVY